MTAVILTECPQRTDELLLPFIQFIIIDRYASDHCGNVWWDNGRLSGVFVRKGRGLTSAMPKRPIYKAVK
jgi:hypothetical protein